MTAPEQAVLDAAYELMQMRRHRRHSDGYSVDIVEQREHVRHLERKLVLQALSLPEPVSG